MEFVSGNDMNAEIAVQLIRGIWTTFYVSKLVIKGTVCGRSYIQSDHALHLESEISLCILHSLSMLSALLLAFGSMETDKYGISKAELNSCDKFSGKNFSEICERLASSRACALVFCKST